MLHLVMIKSIQHKGLRLFYEQEDASKLPAAHVNRIRTILTRLEFAKSLNDIGTPGSRLHPLSGNLKGFYAVNVSGNWRIIFRFDDGNVHDVDYVDYH
jgi:toxin HigB-1